MTWAASRIPWPITKGKYVVLEWNNPDCPFVRKHYDSGNMPKLQQEERAKGVVWLTINSASAGRQGDYPAGQIEKFLKDDHADPTAYLRDPDGKVGHLYEAKTTPHMFVINPGGKLIYQGGIDNKPTPDPADIPGATNYVKASLEESMAGKPVRCRPAAPTAAASILESALWPVLRAARLLPEPHAPTSRVSL